LAGKKGKLVLPCREAGGAAMLIGQTSPTRGVSPIRAKRTIKINFVPTSKKDVPGKRADAGRETSPLRRGRMGFRRSGRPNV